MTCYDVASINRCGKVPFRDFSGESDPLRVFSEASVAFRGSSPFIKLASLLYSLLLLPSPLPPLPPILFLS